jgi:hypothetical protein
VPGAIASLQMSPQGVVHSFYPLEGNQAAMHHNLLKGEQVGQGPCLGGSWQVVLWQPAVLSQRGIPETAVLWQLAVLHCLAVHDCA